jgi:hypothetical protein
MYTTKRLCYVFTFSKAVEGPQEPALMVAS